MILTTNRCDQCTFAAMQFQMGGYDSDRKGLDIMTTRYIIHFVNHLKSIQSGITVPDTT